MCSSSELSPIVYLAAGSCQCNIALNFFTADNGNLVGGWTSGWLIRSGWSVNVAGKFFPFRRI
jgi:hypothetical protein